MRLSLQVILLIVMVIMRKRVALTIALFHVAGKVFIKLPLLVVQPLWTFICLMLFWAYWLMVLLFLGVSGEFVQVTSVEPLQRAVGVYVGGGRGRCCA